MHRKTARIFHNFLIWSMLVFLSACGGSSDSSSTTATKDSEAAKATLQTRLEEYWQARIQGNMQLAFQYEHPDQKEQLGEQIYLARIGSNVKIKEFSVVDPQTLQLDPAAEEARIELNVKYAYTFPIEGTKDMLVPTRVEDSWQKAQGVWYHVLDTRVIAERK